MTIPKRCPNCNELMYWNWAQKIYMCSCGYVEDKIIRGLREW